jgi:myb proto-oncogene protein
MVGGDESNSKIPKMEDHKKVGSTNSTHNSSSSPSHHCHLLAEKFELLETLLDVELKKMASFLGLEND